MKRRLTVKTAKDRTHGAAHRPLRRAAIAAAAAVLIAAGLWLMPATPPAVVQRPPTAPTISTPPPSPAADEPPQHSAPPPKPQEVVSVPVGAAPAPASSEPLPAVQPSIPEPVVLVPKPSGPVLQLGVFGAQDNAERLRAELARLGFPARIESRVVLGPFPDRAAAEAAQAALKRAGQPTGMVVPSAQTP